MMTEAVSYCPESPVPVSPRTRKRTELSLSGSRSWGSCPPPLTPGRPGASERTSASARADSAVRRVIGRLLPLQCCRRGVREHVNDQVGFAVAKNQVALDEPVLERLGQRRQLAQDARRKRRQRIRSRVELIDHRR